jgi:hypothetical protein
MNRPRKVCARSQAVYAIVAGLRPKETAIAVPNFNFWVCSATNGPGKKGSCTVSDDHNVLKPIDSAACAMVGIALRDVGGKAASSSICVHPYFN